MKRKGRSRAEQQNEACGVWLDTSVLKKQKAQSLIARPVLRAWNRLSPCPAPTSTPRPSTKQTTISTFFSAQQTDERKTSTTSPKDPTSPCLERRLGPVSALQPAPQQYEQKSQGSCHPRVPSTQAQGRSRQEDRRTQRPTVGKGESPPYLNRIQPQEEKGGTLPSSPLREKEGLWKRERNQRILPHEATKAQRRDRRSSSLTDGCFVEPDTVAPQLQRNRTPAESPKGVNQPAAGLWSKANVQAFSDEPEESSSSLFTQDSQGGRVISHHRARERGKRPLQKSPLRGKSNPVMSSCGPGSAVEEKTQVATEAGWVLGAGGSQQLGHDLLFTEDSEGNRVIKH